MKSQKQQIVRYNNFLYIQNNFWCRVALSMETLAMCVHFPAWLEINADLSMMQWCVNTSSTRIIITTEQEKLYYSHYYYKSGKSGGMLVY